MENMYKFFFFALILISISACHQPNEHVELAEVPLNYLDGIEPIFDDEWVHIVIEIPAGSNEKWEVNKITGQLEWEKIGDSLRVVKYLPYPANYGMIPGTWLSLEHGGDNDPLDVFLLGPTLERGSIKPAKVIGVIKMLDRGEQDDKLLAVDPESWFGHINSLQELEQSYPGVITILITWLESYKGSNAVEFQRMEGTEAANEILTHAIENYRSKNE